MVTYFFLGAKENNQLHEEKNISNKKIGILDSTSASIFSVRRERVDEIFSFEKCWHQSNKLSIETVTAITEFTSPNWKGFKGCNYCNCLLLLWGEGADLPC